MSEMERIAEVPASTRDEALFIPAVMRDESRGAPRNSKADLTSLRKHERVPQVPIQLERNPKLPSTTPKKTMKFSPPHKMRPFYTAAFPKKPHVPSWNLKGNLKPFMKPQKLPEIPYPLERKAEFPATTQEEPRFPHINSR